MKEADAISPREPVVKPARNPLGKSPAPTAAKVRPPVDMKLDRTTIAQAKMTYFSMDPAGHRCGDIEYFIPPGHDYEQLLKPSYWLPAAAVLKRHGDFTGSIFHVRTTDHRLYARLYVTEISPVGMHVHVLEKAELGVQPDEVKSTNFKWMWNDAARGYDIVRIVDGATVASSKEIKRLQSVKDWLEKWDR
jgi:hypothetical protein